MNRKKFFFKKPVKKSSPKNLIFEPSDEYKACICSLAYLGKKGYTIPKSALEKQDEEFLRKDLFVKPEVHGVSYGAPDENAAFPVFRENNNKIYVPRFYGIQRYGPPHRSEIQDGDDIDVTFDKTLRDYQNDIIDKYMNYVNRPISSQQDAAKASGGILEIFCGAGKCLGKDTEIIMFDGTIKLVQDIVVGDQIMGDDSTPRNVLSLARGREMMYKVQEKKGNGYIVNKSHILSLRCGTKINKNTPKGKIIDISVKDYLNLPDSYHGRAGSLYGYKVPIEFPEKMVKLDPYLLLLGS